MKLDDFSDLNPLDLAEGFAEHAVQWASEAGAPGDCLPVLRMTAFLASNATTQGHVCSHIDALRDALAKHGIDSDPGKLRSQLAASGMVAFGNYGAHLPLVVDDSGRIYLKRYYDYERRLATSLVNRARHPLEITASEKLRNRMDELFARNASRLEGRADWQKLAVALALRNRLTVISGGPGTGKTTTVVALLACLLEQEPDLRIALAAPTGKAAARMLDALRDRAGALPEEILTRLPQESYTVHRLLGVTPQAGKFRHNADNPLAVDVLVVDEASMLDLALATRLINAVPPEGRLILLGDKDQLAAVEAGAVFAELSADPGLSATGKSYLAEITHTSADALQLGKAVKETSLKDCVVWLTESHRFSLSSGIGRLAAEINGGRGENALEWMRVGTDSSIQWIDDGSDTLSTATRKNLLDGYNGYLKILNDQASGVADIFEAFNQFRVLCAIKEGARGVSGINELLGRHAHSLQPAASGLGQLSPWYAGRPVMVLRNDYTLKLFNGDVGICLPNDEGELAVYFPGEKDGFRAIAPLRLPEHDTAFAMTVHKAQGSEFESITLVLPERVNPVLKRELLYTGVTRAKEYFTLIAGGAVFVEGCAQVTERHSGLIDRMDEVNNQV